MPAMPKVGQTRKCFMFSPPQLVKVLAVETGMPCSSGTRITFKLEGYNKGRVESCDSLWFTNPKVCGAPIFRAEWKYNPGEAAMKVE